MAHNSSTPKVTAAKVAKGGLQEVPFDEFVYKRTAGGRPCRLNLGPYVGHPFRCGCGAEHPFDPAGDYPTETPVHRELTGMRLVVGCPTGAVVNCVRLTGLFRFKGFESLFFTPTPE